jgi:hypothetical protein
MTDNLALGLPVVWSMRMQRERHNSRSAGRSKVFFPLPLRSPSAVFDVRSPLTGTQFLLTIFSSRPAHSAPLTNLLVDSKLDGFGNSNCCSPDSLQFELSKKIAIKVKMSHDSIQFNSYELVLLLV